jgi:hypothetical protein
MNSRVCLYVYLCPTRLNSQGSKTSLYNCIAILCWLYCLNGDSTQNIRLFYKLKEKLGMWNGNARVHCHLFLKSRQLECSSSSDIDDSRILTICFHYLCGKKISSRWDGRWNRWYYYPHLIVRFLLSNISRYVILASSRNNKRENDG